MYIIRQKCREAKPMLFPNVFLHQMLYLPFICENSLIITIAYKYIQLNTNLIYNFQSMLIILFLTLTPILCDDNVTTYPVTYSSCLLSLQYYNQDQFNLLNCYYFGKKFWQGSGWGDCTYRCCSPVKSYDQVRSSVENCGSDRESYNNLMAGIIVGSIFGGLLTIALLVLISVKIKEKCQEMAARPVPVRLAPAQISITNIKPKIEWIKMPNKIQSQNCPICLQPKPNLQFSKCRHLGHVQCWKEWSKKSKTCVICRATSQDELKIHCNKCYQAYHTIRGDDINLFEMPSMTCDCCK